MKKLLTPMLCLAAAGMIMTGCETLNVSPERAIFSEPPPLDMLMEVASLASGELLKHPSITEFAAKNKNKKPLIEAGIISKPGRSGIRVEQISERVMDALLDSGQVEVIATGMNVPRPPDFFLDGAILGQEYTYTFQLRMNETKTTRRVWGRSYTIRYDSGTGGWNVDK